MAAWLNKVAAYDRSGEWAVDGYLNAASALRARCRMNVGVARGHVELARKLQHLPVVAEAFAEGEISRSHASVVADAYTPERASHINNVEAQLVGAARDHTPQQLGSLVRHVTNAIDGDGGAATDEALYARRGYYQSSTLDGMLVTNGTFDHVDGEIHKAAIKAEMERDFQRGDGRTPAERRADALTNLLRRSLDAGELGESHNVRPHFLGVVDVENLPGVTAELVDQARTERRRNGFLSDAMLELLTCDCDMSRVIVAGKSEVLDVGRAARYPTAAQWKALVVRDRHCQAPGCDRPPDNCQAHHIVHWTRGGPTNLDNLQLLCWNHHRQTHWQDAQARARDG
jgi:hypothetical protein